MVTELYTFLVAWGTKLFEVELAFDDGLLFRVGISDGGLSISVHENVLRISIGYSVDETPLPPDFDDLMINVLLDNAEKLIRVGSVLDVRRFCLGGEC